MVEHAGLHIGKAHAFGKGYQGSTQSVGPGHYEPLNVCNELFFRVRFAKYDIDP